MSDIQNNNAPRPMPAAPRLGEMPIADHEAEATVVGFLLNQMVVAKAEPWMAMLDEDCFNHPHYKTIYKSMNQLMMMEPPQPPVFYNVMSLLPVLDPMGYITPAMLTTLCERASGEDVTMPVMVLRDMKVRRAMLQLGQTLVEKAHDLQMPMAALIEDAMATLDRQDVTHRHRGTPLHDLIPALKERVNQNQDDQQRTHGPWTGIPPLDDAGGLPESGLVVLAAGTSQGKSSLASHITMQSALHGIASAYFSMEMSNQSLVARMVAMDGRGISAQGIRTWRLNDADWRRTQSEIDELDRKFGQMIYFDDSRTSDLDDICSAIRYMHHAYGIRLVVVDFLQLLNFTTSRRDINTEQLMGQASRRLKNLGDRLGVCILLLSQINRSQANMRPTLSVIRDSGQIAEAADMVIFSWRPDAYHGSYDLDFADYRTKDTMAFLVLKNREGPLMERILHWDGLHTLPGYIPDHELSRYKKGAVEEDELFSFS